MSSKIRTSRCNPLVPLLDYRKCPYCGEHNPVVQLHADLHYETRGGQNFRTRFVAVCACGTIRAVEDVDPGERCFELVLHRLRVTDRQGGAGGGGA